MRGTGPLHPVKHLISGPLSWIFWEFRLTFDSISNGHGKSLLLWKAVRVSLETSFNHVVEKCSLSESQLRTEDVCSDTQVT